MAKKKSNKALWITLISLGIIIIAVLAVYFAKRGDDAIEVVTSKVEERTITQTVSAIGKVQPETEVKISSEVSGEIIFLGPKEGDTVNTGELLVKIKPDIIQTQLEQQKAAADASKMEIEIRKAEKDRIEAELNRIKDLYAKEFVSQQEFDRTKAAYDQAISSYKAALSRYEQAMAVFRQIQRNAARTTISAPIDGIVTMLEVEKGEKVVGTEMMQGTEMMRVSDLSVMNAVVDVDENDIVFVNIGDTVNIEIDAFPDSLFKGIVKEIGHSAKMGSLGTQEQVTNFEVKIRILTDEEKLRPGMSCSVEIETETRYDVLSVPLQAVTVRREEKKAPDVQEERIRTENSDSGKEEKDRPQSIVFLKEGEKAKLVEVETGISDDGYIEIKTGLEKGREIISGSFMAVSKKLYDGAPVKVETTYKKKYSKKR